MYYRRHILLLAALGAPMHSCRADDQPPRFETIEDDCGNKCKIATYVCEGGTKAEDDDQECFDECLDFMDSSLEQGNICAQGFENMMACVGKLETCEEILSWALRKQDNPCTEESSAFDRQCEDF